MVVPSQQVHTQPQQVPQTVPYNAMLPTLVKIAGVIAGFVAAIAISPSYGIVAGVFSGVVIGIGLYAIGEALSACCAAFEHSDLGHTVVHHSSPPVVISSPSVIHHPSPSFVVSSPSVVHVPIPRVVQIPTFVASTHHGTGGPLPPPVMHSPVVTANHGSGGPLPPFMGNPRPSAHSSISNSNGHFGSGSHFSASTPVVGSGGHIPRGHVPSPPIFSSPPQTHQHTPVAGGHFGRRNS